WNASAGLGIQRDEAVAGSHVDDPVVALSVTPVRQPASGQLPGRVSGSLAFELRVNPNELSSIGLECDYRPSCARCRVDHAVNHERRAFELVLGPGAKVVCLEAPRDFELVEVLRVY